MRILASLLGIAGLAAALGGPLLVATMLGPRDFIIPVSSDKHPVKGQFTPTLAQARAAKEAFVAFLRAPQRASARRKPALAWSEAQRPAIATALGTYYLQYLGVPIRWKAGLGERVAGGDPEIEINGACEEGLFGPEEKAMLARSELVATDGGKCFFRADYSLARKRIVWFGVNGLA
jgi:hypothetical protein